MANAMVLPHLVCLPDRLSQKLYVRSGFADGVIPAQSQILALHLVASYTAEPQQ